MKNEERIHGYLLTKEDSGEKFLKIAFLDQSQGILWFLMRRTSPAPATATTSAAAAATKTRTKSPASSATAKTTPDLFDLAEATLNFPKNSTPSANTIRFAADYRLIHRHTGIGSDYERLAAACQFAKILAHNPPPPDNLPAIVALCSRAFDAFANRPRPDATLLKSLWTLALDGGWAVREHWSPSISPADAQILAESLRSPLDAQPAPPARLQPILESLLSWLKHECHFV